MHVRRPCLIAVVTGHAALKETRTGQHGGHGMALAGVILGYPSAVLWGSGGDAGRRQRPIRHAVQVI
jgi:hypothetical protein